MSTVRWRLLVGMSTFCSFFNKCFVFPEPWKRFVLFLKWKNCNKKKTNLSFFYIIKFEFFCQILLLFLFISLKSKKILSFLFRSDLKKFLFFFRSELREFWTFQFQFSSILQLYYRRTFMIVDIPSYQCTCTTHT